MPVSDLLLPFVKQLRFVLKDSAYTFKEIEQRAGMSPKYISHLLHGRINLRVEHTLRLLQAAEVDPNDFFRQIAVLYRAPPDEASEEEHKEMLARIMPELDALFRQMRPQDETGGKEAAEGSPKRPVDRPD